VLVQTESDREIGGLGGDGLISADVGFRHGAHTFIANALGFARRGVGDGAGVEWQAPATLARAEVVRAFQAAHGRRA
jgi:hypothetical protein